MEKKVLPKPAVAGVLEENYIEARLHTDRPSPGLEKILEVQQRFAESVANPIYVAVDPQTESRLDKYEGAALTAEHEENFVRFLTESVERSKSGTKVVKR